MNKKAGEILNKTITLLAKTGGLGVSMDEVAAFAGVSKMTIYKYFSDKTTLFDKAGKAVMARSMAELSDTVHNDKSLVERMTAFLAVSTDFVNSGSFRLCEALQATSPQVKSAFSAYTKETGDLLMALIDEGIKEQCFLPELDKQMIFDYINMGILYYQRNGTYRERMKGDKDYQSRMMTFLVGHIFLDGETMYPRQER